MEGGAPGKAACSRQQCASSLLLMTGSFPFQRGTACSALVTGASFPWRKLEHWYLTLKAISARALLFMYVTFSTWCENWCHNMLRVRVMAGAWSESIQPNGSSLCLHSHSLLFLIFPLD